jgi:hypothetical protein
VAKKTDGNGVLVKLIVGAGAGVGLGVAVGPVVGFEVGLGK